MFDSGACSASKSRARADRRVQRPRGGAQPVVERAEPVGAVALQRHPDLERVEPARALEAAHALVPRRARRSARGTGTARAGRTPASRSRSSRTSTAPAASGISIILCGSQAIERARSMPCARRACAAEKQRRGAVGAVDVQPQRRAPRTAGRSRRGRRTSPSRCCRRWPRRPSPAAGRGLRASSSRSSAARSIRKPRDGHGDRVVGAEAERADRARHRVVRVLAVHDHRRAPRPGPAPRVRAAPRRARRAARERGLRAAAGEGAARAGRRALRDRTASGSPATRSPCRPATSPRRRPTG